MKINIKLNKAQKAIFLAFRIVSKLPDFIKCTIYYNIEIDEFVNEKSKSEHVFSKKERGKQVLFLVQ